VNAKKTRVAILISGRGSNMRSLVDAARGKNYPAEIVLVLSNKAEAEGLAFAKAFSDREAFERVLQAKLLEHGVELVCLAGFMRVLTAWFVEQWREKMLNIHPALLPSYRGLHTHERALADGVKIHGATVHFVSPEMDAGPIVAQAAVPVLDSDTPDALAARVLEQEHRIYPLALSRVASGAARVEGFRVRIAGEPSAPAALIWPAN